MLESLCDNEAELDARARKAKVRSAHAAIRYHGFNVVHGRVPSWYVQRIVGNCWLVIVFTHILLSRVDGPILVDFNAGGGLVVVQSIFTQFEAFQPRCIVRKSMIQVVVILAP